jgi:hypothetical protein
MQASNEINFIKSLFYFKANLYRIGDNTQTMVEKSA